MLSQAEQRRELLRSIKRRFRLRKLPLRIECFDNSTLQGQSLAAMVVFKEAKKIAILIGVFSSKMSRFPMITRQCMRFSSDDFFVWTPLHPATGLALSCSD